MHFPYHWLPELLDIGGPTGKLGFCSFVDVLFGLAISLDIHFLRLLCVKLRY